MTDQPLAAPTAFQPPAPRIPRLAPPVLRAGHGPGGAAGGGVEPSIGALEYLGRTLDPYVGLPDLPYDQIGDAIGDAVSSIGSTVAGWFS
ncbi:hypothetical protein ACIRST_04545 [Kitasatospora sp. NPDC101447]|uniref:hypothetical protein n=1 Tax=Kitasatospora sp. NPDC101447 TaxID=3364102 RepID=UPI00380E5EA7